MTDNAAILQLTRRIAPLLNGPPDQCLNISVAGDEARWVQYVDGQVNAATLETDPPDALLSDLGDAVFIDFSPRKYLTVNLTRADPAGIAAWIVAYLHKGLGADVDPVLDTSVEAL